MNKKSMLVATIVILVAASAVATMAYMSNQSTEVSTNQNFNNTLTSNPSPTATETPTPTLSPNPTPTPSSDQTVLANSITLESPNSGSYLLGSKVNIKWTVSGSLPSNAFVVISLMGPTNSVVYGEVASVKAASGEYAWYPGIVKNNGQTKSILGDRNYWIKISLYNGNPTDSDLISEDLSNASFELAYGGPPTE